MPRIRVGLRITVRDPVMSLLAILAAVLALSANAAAMKRLRSPVPRAGDTDGDGPSRVPPVDPVLAVKPVSEPLPKRLKHDSWLSLSPPQFCSSENRARDESTLNLISKLDKSHHDRQCHNGANEVQDHSSSAKDWDRDLEDELISLQTYPDLVEFVSRHDMAKFLMNRIATPRRKREILVPLSIPFYIGDQRVHLPEIYFLSHATTSLDKLLCLVSLEQKLKSIPVDIMPAIVKSIWTDAVIPVRKCLVEHCKGSIAVFCSEFDDPFPHCNLPCTHQPAPWWTVTDLQNHVPTTLVRTSRGLDYVGRIIPYGMNSASALRMCETVNELTANVPEQDLHPDLVQFLSLIVSPVLWYYQHRLGCDPNRFAELWERRVGPVLFPNSDRNN